MLISAPLVSANSAIAENTLVFIASGTVSPGMKSRARPGSPPPSRTNAGPIAVTSSSPVSSKRRLTGAGGSGRGRHPRSFPLSDRDRS